MVVEQMIHAFQFHKGAIRTSCGEGHISKVLNFNSIKVRLERSGVEFGELVEQKFQFHKGAIRTAVALIQVSVFHISIP